MPRTPQSQLNAARKLLTDAQLIAFFRAAAKDEQFPQAIRWINRDLDKGKTLDTFVNDFGPHAARQGGFNLSLRVKQLEERVFTISYSLGAGHCGDGGEWRVTFAESGELLEVEQGPCWIA